RGCTTRSRALTRGLPSGADDGRMPSGARERVDRGRVAGIPGRRGGSGRGRIFLRIVAGAVCGEVVACDEGGVAFLDVQPLADGHTLVVPRAHEPSIEALDAPTAEALFRLVRRLSQSCLPALG